VEHISVSFRGSLTAHGNQCRGLIYRSATDRLGKRSVPFTAARRGLPNVARQPHVTHPPLSIALSEDDGVTWRHVRDLDIPTEPHVKLSHPTVRDPLARSLVKAW
jgi:hypothetical protein